MLKVENIKKKFIRYTKDQKKEEFFANDGISLKLMMDKLWVY